MAEVGTWLLAGDAAAHRIGHFIVVLQGVVIGVEDERPHRRVLVKGRIPLRGGHPRNDQPLVGAGEFQQGIGRNGFGVVPQFDFGPSSGAGRKKA